jgi:hypothetical protein
LDDPEGQIQDQGRPCRALPPFAVEIMRRRLEETDGDYVFAARDPEHPFNGAASALRRLPEGVKNALHAARSSPNLSYNAFALGVRLETGLLRHQR